MQLKSRTGTRTIEKIVVREFGAPDVLQIEPEIFSPNQEEGVLIETWLIGVGYVDVMAQRGGYFLAPRRPFSPGYECIGRVIKAPASSEFAVGETVAALLPRLGAYQSLLEIPESRLVKLPAGVDPVKGAAAILNYLTALCILDRKSSIKTGDSILIHGASGGVGTALAQIGRQRGLKMYGTASAAKHDLLQELDVFPIDYRLEDFVKVIRQQEAAGVAAAFDAIGGRNLRRSVAAVKRGGVVVSYGLSGNNYGGYWEMIKGIFHYIGLNLVPNGKRVTMCGTPAETVKDPGWYRRTLSQIFDQIGSGELEPVIDRIFPFHAVRDAHAYLESGKVRGKVLLRTPAFSDQLE